MATHDNYDNKILKQLTRIADSLENIEKKIPDASRIRFGETLTGGLYIGYNPREGESFMDRFAKAMKEMGESDGN